MAEEDTGAPEGAAEQTPAPTMEESMGAVFDKMQEAPDPAKEPAASTVPEVQPEASADARPRGPDGKFIKADKPDESAPKAVTATDQPKPVEQATAPSTAPVAPPPSWSADAKIAWTQLPPAVQQAVLKREDEVSIGFRQKSDELKTYAGLEQVIGPRRQLLAANYGSVESALQQLFALSDFASKDAPGFLSWFAQQRGINLQQLQPAESTPVDPTIAALQTKLQSFESYLKQQEDQKRLSEQQTIQSQIDTFRSALSADGSPKHPHFEDVRAEMAALMQAGRAESLDQAYEMATWASPTVRAKILADQKARDDEQRRKDAEAKAAEARRVQGTNLSSRGAVSGSPVKPTSIEETMAAVFDRMSAA